MQDRLPPPRTPAEAKPNDGGLPRSGRPGSSVQGSGLGFPAEDEPGRCAPRGSLARKSLAARV